MTGFETQNLLGSWNRKGSWFFRIIIVTFASPRTTLCAVLCLFLKLCSVKVIVCHPTSEICAACSRSVCCSLIPGLQTFSTSFH